MNTGIHKLFSNSQELTHILKLLPGEVDFSNDANKLNSLVFAKIINLTALKQNKISLLRNQTFVQNITA